MFFSAFVSNAQKVISLYPDKISGSENWNWPEKVTAAKDSQLRTVYNVTKPTLTVYTPSKASDKGTAVIICSGGGFYHLAFDKEGTMVAQWLNSKGITAFVLKYRLVKTDFDTSGNEVMDLSDRKKIESKIAPVVAFAITDALVAVKYVRENAEAYKIEKNRIGIMGFSAGGTVASGVVFNADSSNHPDFLGAIYAYTGALKNSSVPSDAPPAFIVAASDDQLVPAVSSTKLYNDWINAGKSAELHIYSKGGHGFGMVKKNLPVDSWIDCFGDWLGLQGLL